MGLPCRSIRIAVAIVLAAAAPLAFAAASCDQSDPCAARTCRIDAGIAQAKAKGDAKALAKLERAKAEMSKCSVDGLKEKRKMALEQAQRRIDLSAADLAKAQAGGDPAKIKSAQRKLDDARKTYSEIQSSPQERGAAPPRLRKLVDYRHRYRLRLGLALAAPQGVGNDHRFRCVGSTHINRGDVGHSLLRVFLARGAPAEPADSDGLVIVEEALHWSNLPCPRVLV